MIFENLNNSGNKKKGKNNLQKLNRMYPGVKLPNNIHKRRKDNSLYYGEQCIHRPVTTLNA